VISLQPPRITRSSYVVTPSRPPTISSLKITYLSFRYASPRLWNQLPDSFRQSNQSCLDSSPHLLVNSSLSSSPLSASITPLFHSVLFWKQKGGGTNAEGANIEGPRGWSVGRGCPLPTGEGFGKWAVLPPQKKNLFWSSKSLVLLHFDRDFCKLVYDGWVALRRSFWLSCSGKQRERARF